MLKEKRATRGKRMSDLIGEALEEDEKFYSSEIWAEVEEDSEDDSYEEEDIKPDVFDSDFNDTEEEESSDDDEAVVRKTERSDITKGNKSSNKYIEPVKKAKKSINKGFLVFQKLCAHFSSNMRICIRITTT
jgi:hypothetical protein